MNAPVETAQTISELCLQRMAQYGWSNKTFARLLDVKPSGASKILKGVQEPTIPQLLKIAAILDLPNDAVMNLFIKEQAAKLSALALPSDDDKRVFKIYREWPVEEMQKRGWLRIDENPPKEQIIKIFGKENASLAYAKKTDEFACFTPKQRAWIFRVRKLASTLKTKEFKSENIDECLGKLKEFSVAPDGVDKVSSLLTEYGIRLVIVEPLKGSRIDGVCLWEQCQPIVGLTLRFDRVDNFWFVLRHELEHVKNGDGKQEPALDEDVYAVKSNVAEAESKANKAASEFCCPHGFLEQFIKASNYKISDAAVKAFAQGNGLNVGLVAGQLRHKLNVYSRFGKLIPKVRQDICRTCLTDGWGYVLPV